MGANVLAHRANDVKPLRMTIELQPKDPRDRIGRYVGMKLPVHIVEILDRESARLNWNSRNKLILELIRPWANEQEAKHAAKKGGAK
jgi:hypothetical protein